MMLTRQSVIAADGGLGSEAPATASG